MELHLCGLLLRGMPQGVDPAAAIQLGKVESSKDYLIAMFKPGE